jgi:hypothetical protein
MTLNCIEVPQKKKVMSLSLPRWPVMDIMRPSAIIIIIIAKLI